jgi:phosphatidylserine/phosphatidylglycerophosphate/cardiolipin synthase-like enzyme
VTQLLKALGPVELDRLAGAIEAGRIDFDRATAGVTRVIARELAEGVVTGFRDLSRRGLDPPGIALLLRTVAAERRAQRELAERVELVWTDPEQPSARDTAVVVRGLCARAKRDLLLANYAFDHPRSDDARARARSLWAPLAQNMDANPMLRVRMFVNVGRDWNDTTSEDATLIRDFVARFRGDLWPGERMPELFHDPRALQTKDETNERGCMHAKCIVVDGEEVLITSANFTQAAQARNVEAGLVLRDEVTARRVIAQFERLVELRRLLAVPVSC